MSIRKMAMLMAAALVSLAAVTPVVYANDEGKACKADTDCEHGEHCKEGHCHK